MTRFFIKENRQVTAEVICIPGTHAYYSIQVLFHFSNAALGVRRSTDSSASPLFSLSLWLCSDGACGV